MSRHEEPTADEGFDRKLDRLRLKIDLLPETQRPHLCELADIIARQRRRLQNRKPRNYDAD